MNDKEAIKRLKEVIEDCTSGEDEPYREAFGMGISALEKQLNGGWIPVSERLPECEEKILILTERNKIKTAMYEDGKMDEEDSAWNWYEIEYDYDEENGVYYIPKGWFEYRRYSPDGVYNNAVDEKVIAWQPLPETYKGVEKAIEIIKQEVGDETNTI